MMNCSMYYTMRYFLRSGKDKCSGKKDIRHIRVFFYLAVVCVFVGVCACVLACLCTHMCGCMCWNGNQYFHSICISAAVVCAKIVKS